MFQLRSHTKNTFFLLTILLGLFAFFVYAADKSVASTKTNEALNPTYIELAETLFDFGSTADFVLDESQNRLYATSGHQTVVIINTLTGQMVTEITGLTNPAQLALSPDGSQLFVGNQIAAANDTVQVVNTATLSVVATHPFTDEIVDMAAGPDGRLYLGPDADANTMISVMDVDTGAVVSTIPVGASSSAELPLVAVANNFYVAIPKNSGAEAELHKYDISAITATQIITSFLPTGAFQMDVTPDEQRVGIRSFQDSKINLYNASTFSETNNYEVSSGYVTVRFAADSQSALGLYRPDGLNGPGAIHEIDLVTGEISRRFVDRNVTTQALMALPLDGGNALLVYSDRIKLLGAADYGAALPIILNDYCRVAYVDDFSSPSSGWPIRVSNGSTYGYLNGEYQIYHANTNRWGALSINQVIEGDQTLILDTRVANGRIGSQGLLYGLNNDSTNFYTFEILPQSQEWLVFNFDSTGGWTLLGQGTSGVINSGTGTNELKLVAQGGHFLLHINGTPITTIARHNGRIGFTGGSLQGDVDLRYDNYTYVNENCPLPTINPGAPVGDGELLILDDHPLIGNREGEQR
ncbi:MAG: hypothetical protein KDE34_10720 [Anaerolineales bacterium]|nr:hypothetical protein [Anaerolineales bacterium]